MTLKKMRYPDRVMNMTLVAAMAAVLPAMTLGGISGNQIDPPIAPPITPPAGAINIECVTLSAGVATYAQGMVFNVGQSVIGPAGNASVLAFTGIVGCLTEPPGPPPIVPGDCDEDGDVDLADYACFFECESGVGGGVDPNCETYDFDVDDDVDLTDWGRFQVLFGSGL